uniref:Uncharacterized protein n=1 Tax=Thalassionema nitzschioides TaxID=33649 RepID=A0A7S1E3B8_9STRA|mmetsp:Transcript_365/g.372  ORF Transcript_365/g.372 Transcript_365/m.372 type:complete len:156 (+) Transcript_365:38-505(+)
MLQRFLLFLASVAFVSCQIDPCVVCGPGWTLTDEGNDFTIPPPYDEEYGMSTVTCGNLNLAGKMGLIPKELCDILPDQTNVRDICECERDEDLATGQRTSPPEPTPAPGAGATGAEPTPAPVSSPPVAPTTSSSPVRSTGRAAVVLGLLLATLVL